MSERFVVKELSPTPSGYKRYGVLDTQIGQVVSIPYFSQAVAENRADELNKEADRG